MNNDIYSYRGGLREGVVFLLLDDKRRVLIECRPDNQGKFTDLFYPSGSIEITDHKDGQSDYRETVLRREVGEEFRNGVKIEGSGLVRRSRQAYVRGQRALWRAAMDVHQRGEKRHSI